MKKLTLKEHKKVLVEILNFMTKKSLENNINYSLIGGSLIGSIRHKGIIPWDDDIDVVLMPEEYEKLIKILSVDEGEYKLLEPGKKGYFYPFAKLVDTRTMLNEKVTKNIPEYGSYVDIFQYHYVSNNLILRFIHYKILILVKMFLASTTLSDQEIKNEKNILKKIRNRVASIIGMPHLMKMYLSLCNKKKKTNYIITNWPTYGFKKEIQKAKSLRKYEMVEFEGIKAMITSDYDEVLTTTFGDYMKLPPESQRKTHHEMEVYWRD